MEASDIVYHATFDPVSGETEYDECLVMEINEEAGKAKVAYATPNGYGNVENFVLTDNLTASKEEE